MNKIQTIHDHKLVDFWGFLSSRPDILTGALAGLVIGLLIVWTGPTFTLIVLFALAYVVVLIRVPEIAVLLLLLLTSGLLPNSFNPSFDLLVGHFQLSDLILISLLGTTGIRLLIERDFRLRPSPLYLPLAIFCLSVFAGILTAVIQHGIPFSHTTYEARIMLYYSSFFAVTNLVRTRQQARRLVYGIIAIGTLVAVLIILQIVLGFSIPIIPPVYFKTDLLARAYHPGFFAVFMTMMALICSLAFQMRRLQTVATWATILVLVLSNIVTLGRNIVVSTLLSLIALFLLLHKSQRVRWLQNMLLMTFLAIGIFSLLQILVPSATVLAYPSAMVDRFAHFFTTDPMSTEETALWRIKEVRYAWEKISQNPLWGIGLNTVYRPTFTEVDTLQSYIHNGYLWVWLKTGLLGLVSFLWFLIIFLVRGFRKWMTIPDEFLRATALGFTLVIFAMLISNFVAPLLVEGFNLAFFAASMGLVETSFVLEQKMEEQQRNDEN